MWGAPELSEEEGSDHDRPLLFPGLPFPKRWSIDHLFLHPPPSVFHGVRGAFPADAYVGVFERGQKGCGGQAAF